MRKNLYKFSSYILISLFISCSHSSNKGNESSLNRKEFNDGKKSNLNFFFNDTLNSLIILESDSLQNSFLEIQNSLSSIFCTRCNFTQSNNQIIFRNKGDVTCRSIKGIDYDSYNKILIKTTDSATVIYTEVPREIFIEKFRLFNKNTYYAIEQQKYLQDFPYHGGHSTILLPVDSLPEEVRLIISNKTLTLKNGKNVFPKYFYNISISYSGNVDSLALQKENRDSLDKELFNYVNKIIKNRKFQPALFLDGEPVNTKFRLMVSFKIE
ncbi:hypothetical protein ACFX5U_07675 [Sphingobacterium sp. SG20118]|uniref:hypothetical protein n=1 Tax=Sphingobacterium sp. SG20118 TaxID=3367156 RepID=UPI0037DFC837